VSFAHSVWNHLSFTLVVTTAVLGLVHVVGWLAAHKRLPRLRLWSPDVGEQHHGHNRRFVFALLAIAGMLSFVPAGDVDLSGHLLAYSGELSFATLFVLSMIVRGNLDKGHWFFDQRNLQAALVAWALCGLVLYLTTLTGRGPDVYALGYEESLAWIALAISVVAASRQCWVVATLMLGAVLAWHLRLGGSVNLWDYAVDPFIFAASAAQILARVRGSFARGGTKRFAGLKIVGMDEPVVSKAA
jgi:hypothetical protein